jgi:hypothetical protein
MSKPKPDLRRTVKIDDAIDYATSEIESLASEMREWADNLEEKFSSTSKYETVSNTADLLEGISPPDVPGEVEDVEVEYMELAPRRRGYSRAARSGQACYVLDQCIAALQEIADDENATEERRDAAEGLKDELEQIKDEAEQCEFPGMYG